MDQLLAIRSFIRVAETGSFSRAADSLNMPKATVSKLIKELEGHVGARLLQRTTRRVSVTADGNAYYDRTARLIRELEDADQRFSAGHVLPKGRIRIDVIGTLARLFIIPALPEFFARYPDLQIDFGISDKSADLIGDTIDCVIRGGSTSDLSMVARLLGTTSWTTCATPGYLEKYGRPIHPNDLLLNHRIIGFHSPNSGRPMPSRFMKNNEVIEIDGPYSVSVNDGAARAVAGLTGIGILQTFSYVIKDQIANGSLVPILEDWSQPPYPFHVIYPQNRALSRRVRVFIDWVVELFDRLD
jgi:LysR family transcriptional regulator, regulator for bpeEF and oprC